MLLAEAAGNAQLKAADERHEFRAVERPHDDAGVQVLVFVGVGVAVDFPVRNREGIIEPVAKQIFAVDHGAFVREGTSWSNIDRSNVGTNRSWMSCS